MNEKAKERLLWPDYAKGISVSLITIYHTIGGIVTSGCTGVKSLNLLSDYSDITHDFRVTVFFLLSGYMAQRTIQKRGEGYVRMTVLKSVLYPYVLWTLIQAFLLNVTKAGNHQVTWDLLPSFLVTGWMEFWFLHTLLLIFGLDLLLRALGTSATFRTLLGMMLLVAATFLPKPAWLPLSYLCEHYVFFGLGCMLTGFNLKFSKAQLWGLLCAGTTLLLFFHYHGCEFGQPLFAAAAISGIVACLALCMLLPSSPLLTPLRLIGQYSLQGFCTHVMFAAGVRAILLHFGYVNFYGHCILGIAAGLIFPVVAAVLDEKYFNCLFRLPKGNRQESESKLAKAPQSSQLVQD